ncbi:aminotransferase class I/II-fold pyridoxal phosphate-dependent enzyme [Telmatospirillum sp.]|uniref:pyridoxal phosphate-dependent aminotransferase n=1 Tax=Telmatospirillum sp. TaxID=2079197 RepID=UPI00283EC5E0|nr:aminotransferase class I/II-fold pyridoxal phosphate-dependent enzyme [Telmatospirillum sp.]MDR3439357.1 aminotransferase class I/II-fold pyridoxal phosphate-dependent enzyme [Telmatospirillum sp.]
MTLKAAGRGLIPPFIVMDVMRAAAERAAAGHDVLHLEVGQPSTGAPRKAVEAAKRALDADPLGYTLAFGLDRLRERIAEHYRASYQVAVDPANVVVTTGSSGAFVLSFLAAFEAGDRVGLASPGYPAYRNILASIGVEPVLIPVGPASGFQPTVDILKARGERLDGLILASPSNPTGSMVSPTALAALSDWCTAEGVRLISDEIYHGLTYEQTAATAAGRGGAVVINSFSKYFSMTGWRLGWMVLPDDLLRSVECLGQNLFISPPTLSQHAAIAVFDCLDELDANVARYARNREILLAELPSAGFERLAPADGAFYLYADVSRWTDNSLAFCRRMLEETGVACTPGVDFDPFEGHRHLRLSFAGATEDMIEAARRLKAWRK